MNLHLVLFFTRGVSLRTWAMMGNLDREVAVYKRLIQRGFRVSFVTYGVGEDLAYAERLGGIRILCNYADLPRQLYEKELMSLHGDALRDCDVIKTNQTYGADVALAAARLFGKPLVARCGYMWSHNAAKEHGANSRAAQEAMRVEREVFTSADVVVVTTAAMREDVAQRFPDAAARVRIIPNYVDTDLFRPDADLREMNRLLFVGRIAPEKNLRELLEAIEPLSILLTLIGEGRLRPELQERFAHLDGKVTWEGTVPNAELPGHLNRAAIFVLPSLYEGHPKALIEAMACGTAVIGANSPGIREIIRHRETGYLCDTDSKSIRSALEVLLGNAALRETLGAAARRHIVEHYSLDRVLEQECALLREVVREY